MKISRERLLLALLVAVFMVLSWSCSSSSEDQNIPIKIQTPATTSQTQETATTQATKTTPTQANATTHARATTHTQEKDTKV